jgi:hypothetical protein
MTQPARKNRTNTIQLLVALVGFFLLAYYATVSLFSRDPLWFLRMFSDEPSRIVVYHDGRRTELQPGQADFDELSRAVQASLAEGFKRLTSVGFSEQTLREAYTQHLTLEVFFDQPVDLHAWFRTGRTTQLLFPITGRHSELSIALLGDGGEYRSGAPALNNMEPIRETLRSQGYY